MKMLKLSKAILSASTALMMMVTPVLGQTNDSSFVNSGDEVDVNTSSSQTTNIDVNNTNTANIEQKVKASADTGHNVSSENIGGGSVSTGNAVVNVQMGAVANQNTTAISGVNPSSANLTDVVNTGDEVDVDTSTRTRTTVNVNNTNSAYVDQYAKAYSNSGYNKANENIGGGSVDTGNAGVNVGMGVAVNDNRTAIGGVGGNGSSLTNATSLVNTGDELDLDTRAKSKIYVNVNNTNSAYVDQYAKAYSNSGYNKANENIGGGSVDTGNAAVVSDMSVLANSNRTALGLGLFPASVNVNDVVNTGDELDLDSNVKTNLTLAANNTNALSGLQSLFSNTSSGKNYSNENIGGGSVDSGFAGAGGEFSILSNRNTTVFGTLADFILGFLGL